MKSNLFARLFLFSVLVAATSLALAKPYPLEYWALREVMSNVQVSPDGKHMALMKIPNRDGNPVVEVYRTADIGLADAPEPYRLNADPMEIVSIDWVSDTDIIVVLRQKVRDRIEGFNQGVYEFRFAKLDIAKQEIKQFDDASGRIENLLPSKPTKVIYSTNEAAKGSKVPRRFRPRNYYELDLKRGTKKLLIRGSPERGQIEFDGEGHPWISRGFDIARGDFVWFHRKKGSKRWDEIHRENENNFSQFRVEGFDVANPDVLFVTATNGHDKAGLWEFNANNRSYGELVYRRPDVDVSGVRFHSNGWTNPDTVVAVAAYKDTWIYEYFDGVEQATYKQLEELVSNPGNLRITSRSRDGNTVTFRNTGPRDPGSFYLLAQGKVTKVGSRQPLLAGDELADVTYITYKARDGVEIPAFLTVPNGQAPFPLVVMPHGGPFVRETVGYDEWAQLMANNGYMVLQPQYRGSRGYGMDFYKSAFVDGGQGGYKMQDDKDDGALHLVKEGLVDPNRIAMYGWSYGGYAALVAASRSPQIYQCVIAGAAVTDTLHQVNYYRDRLRGASGMEQENMWTTSISPVKEVAKVNVPILMIHGDVDQRVPPIHARKYIKAIEETGKSFKYVELEGADHFSNTLFYHHQLKLYENLIGYLKNDCGPGGL